MVIIAAAMPIILLLRAIFVGRSQKTSRAFAEFKKQIDYLVWAILFVIGCVFVYSIAGLIHSMWR
jgi:cytochrome c biogenesis protein CcdA